MVRARPAALAACLLALVPAPALGIGEWQGERVSLAATGSVRLTGAFMHYYNLPDEVLIRDDGLQAGVGRLILDGDLSDRLSYEANLFVDASRSPAGAVGGAFSTAGSFASPYRHPDSAWDFWEGTLVRGRLGIDRLHLKADLEPVNLSLGRFPVNFSVTNLLTPNDFFSPFAATAINTVYKPGVDGLRVAVGLGAMSLIEAVVVAGYTPDDGEPTWVKSAALVRLSTVHWGVEWAALGGKVAGREIIGGSLQADLTELNLRAEGHVGLPDRSERVHPDDETHARVAVGIDKTITWRNSTVGLEYAFYSDGASRPAGYLERAAHLYPDDLAYLGRHYVGLTAGGEIIPILRIGATVLVNAGDLSGIVAMLLSYNIADEADFAGGLIAGWGEQPRLASTLPPRLILESEFGSVPLAAFLETRFYF